MSDLYPSWLDPKKHLTPEGRAAFDAEVKPENNLALLRRILELAPHGIGVSVAGITSYLRRMGWFANEVDVLEDVEELVRRGVAESVRVEQGIFRWQLVRP
jgi:hypothetical protein